MLQGYGSEFNGYEPQHLDDIIACYEMAGDMEGLERFLRANIEWELRRQRELIASIEATQEVIDNTIARINEFDEPF